MSLYVIDVFRLDEVLPSGGTGKAYVPVICYGPPEELSRAWHGGCADYLKEPWTMAELHFRIERLLPAHGGRPEAGRIALDGMEMVCRDIRCELSAQETKILALLLRDPGAIVPREAMYYGIWGKTGSGSRVVDMHVSRLRNKLASIQRSVPQRERLAIKTARGEGYVLR